MTLTEITQGYLAELGLDATMDKPELLRQLQCRHIARFSFNSLAVVLSQEIPLDSASVYRKIVVEKRGGYCFEHNKLVFDVLTTLGYEARILMARVVYNKEDEVPRTHRITLVTLDGESYIVDAGFGHFGARLPLKLVPGLEQEQEDERFRMVELAKGDIGFQIWKDSAYFTLYRFDLNHYNEADCLAGHFYSHKFPTAGFVNNLVVSRKLQNKIYSLRNGDFYHIEKGETQISKIQHIEELHQKLTQWFELPVDRAVSEFLYHKFVVQG
ncbi:MAG: arylamine N-acetyltransferase [Hahellaceae bacterium]|nr:arylamine N-acetyltransferase [Hahellaceae bacterium]MCP5168232.1 arylamine N-acetyltransferase [Hahellaceae bacterium]